MSVTGLYYLVRFEQATIPAVLRTLERFPALPSLSMLGVVSERVAPVEAGKAAQRVLVWEREID